MILCPGRAPITVPSISPNFTEPPLLDGGTLLITIDGAECDLNNVQALARTTGDIPLLVQHFTVRAANE